MADSLSEPFAYTLEVEPNHLILTRGSILLSEKNCVQVDTPHGRILVKPNSVATITTRRNITRVQNLHDIAKDSVQVICGKHLVSLRPGKEACMVSTANADTDAETLVWSDHMARRRLHFIPVEDNKSLALSDFSHLEAMEKEDILVHLRASKDNADKELAAKLVKTGAAISYARDRQREPYSRPFTPAATESVASLPSNVQ